MTPFKEWEEGSLFEMDNPPRFGVKTGAKSAFMFDTNREEVIHHLKRVTGVRSVRGRLARTHDNRLIVVEEATPGLYAGYYVNLTGYATFQKSDFSLIPINLGHRRDEVDIILQQMGLSIEKAQKWFSLLKTELIE